jgi:hypothetical protein
MQKYEVPGKMIIQHTCVYRRHSISRTVEGKLNELMEEPLDVAVKDAAPYYDYTRYKWPAHMPLYHLLNAVVSVLQWRLRHTNTRWAVTAIE